MAKLYSTPGVYIEEKSAFTNSVVPVATAIPCFIGFTEKATRDHQSLTKQLVKIASFDEYIKYFGGKPLIKYDATFNDPNDPIKVVPFKASQLYLYYSLKLYFNNGGGDCYIYSCGGYGTPAAASKLEAGMVDHALQLLLKEPEPTMIVIPDGHTMDSAADYYDLFTKALPHCREMINRFAILDIHGGGVKDNLSEPSKIANLHKVFKNSIGTNDLNYGAVYWPWVQATVVQPSDLDFRNLNNLDVLKAEITRITPINYKPLSDGSEDPRVAEITKMVALMGKVVLTSTEAAAAKTDADSAVKTTDAAAKTANAAAKAAPDDAALANAAKFADEAKAAAKTAADEAKAVVDAITTADNAKAKADASSLIALAPSATDAEIATATTDAAAAVAAELAASIDTNDTAIISRQHNVMLQVSPLYKAVMMRLREVANVLPPSAAMAGAYKATDSSVGTHQAPANISLISVSKPMVNLDDHEQEGLNVPIDGKAINAIRSFPGKGVLVWGARTMDGNSQDWRYISVRRTVSMIELSIKYAAEVFVFQPNNSSTWSNLKAMITNFLTNMWYAGALAGATPESAFSVDVGIGTTMTSVDILDGYMRVSVKIAVTRPAEFIVITFEQQMQTS